MTQSPSTDTPAAPCIWSAELRPHRSLSPAGFVAVMTAIAGGGFLMGIAFFLVGAWPVAGFCGLEILLLYVAFRLNFRAGRQVEQLRLCPGQLEVMRKAPSGRVTIRHFEPTWLKVGLTGRNGRNEMITLTSHGSSLVLGRFLTPGERKSLVEEMRHALHDYRAGRHLNPCEPASV